jgi:hypothetical protein
VISTQGETIRNVTLTPSAAPHDCDNDGILSDVDNCPDISNVGQQDNEGDGLGDVCDPDDDNDGLVDGAGGVVLTTTYAGIDADNDGYVDGELDFGTNPMQKDTDGDGFEDGTEVIYGSNPLANTDTPANGDVNDDGTVNAVDVLQVMQFVLGTDTPTTDEFIRSDVAPFNGTWPEPDGVINAGDVLRIQQMGLGM